MLDPAAQGPVVPEHGPDLEHALDLVDHLVPGVLAGHGPAARVEAHLRPAKRRVRSALRQAGVVVDGHNIRRPKKVQ
jgi:hypothetical protein